MTTVEDKTSVAKKQNNNNNDNKKYKNWLLWRTIPQPLKSGYLLSATKNQTKKRRNYGLNGRQYIYRYANKKKKKDN